MKNALDTLTKAEAQIAALRSLIEANPGAFAQWDFSQSGHFDSSLLQFFPADLPAALSAREEAAKAMARVFGGSWRKQPDGDWRSDPITVGGMQCRLILHDVDLAQKREGTVVEL